MNEYTVLVIDDHPMMGQALVANFRQREHAARAITDPDVALEWLEGNHCDIVILDLGLGDGALDGMTLLQNIRASKKLARLPIIVFTGEGHRDSIVAACLASGANACLSKEQDFKDLYFVAMGILSGAIPPARSVRAQHELAS